MDQLKQENDKLRAELEQYRKKFRQLEHSRNAIKNIHSNKESKFPGPDTHTTIVVIGGSGDLAKKKTFPSLFALYGLGLLPQNFSVIGYARSNMTDAEFRKQATVHFKGFDDKKQAFIDRLFYVSGQYGSASDFAKLDEAAAKLEGKLPAHRVFYMAIPPSVFVDVAKAIYASAKSKTGSTRVIVEKPFGRDFQSSEELSTELGALFSEEEVYRIDHYLGKEIVQNLMSLRFANLVWEPLWNRNHVANVVITFKENIGTEGRGGYFDQFGIIRDVMQNHLFQILSLVAMEPPVTLNAEDIRDEKVKVLKAISPLTTHDLVIGQYTRDAEGKNPGYLEDPGVPKDSITPTFAAAVFHINNSRWRGVPFILKCGKGLDERKAEIRIQFKTNANNLYPQATRNELVLRVQPNEAVYMKLNAKLPGLSEELVQTELDLSYKSRFDARLPDAYERLIYDVLRGDHNLFVRVDELSAAWKIFTPVLHQLEREKIKPEVYAFGSRGPASSDELLKKYGFERSSGYQWPQTKL